MIEPKITFANKPTNEAIAKAWEVILRHYGFDVEVTLKEIDQKEENVSETTEKDSE